MVSDDTAAGSTVSAQRFDGKTVIVTGSTRGIGRGIAERFVREGANVVVNDHGAEDGEAVAADLAAVSAESGGGAVESGGGAVESGGREANSGGDVVYVQADVRDPDAVEALVDATVEEFGKLDALVNNAAVQSDTAADEATIEEWERVVETDFRGYWLAAKHAASAMDGGAIVNVSSNHARLTMPDHFPYNAVKAGIDGMTRAMALDFGPGIRVNAVNPGWVAVDRTTSGMDADEREHLASIHPVGRLGRPEDIAAAVAFLASDEAGFLTGECVLVDGGRSAVMQDDTLPDYRERRE